MRLLLASSIVKAGKNSQCDIETWAVRGQRDKNSQCDIKVLNVRGSRRLPQETISYLVLYVFAFQPSAVFIGIHIFSYRPVVYPVFQRCSLTLSSSTSVFICFHIGQFLLWVMEGTIYTGSQQTTFRMLSDGVIAGDPSNQVPGESETVCTGICLT